MDLATLIGLIGAFGIVLASIMLGGSAGTFVNTPSLLVVLGGTLMVTMMKFSLAQFLGATSIAVKAGLTEICTEDSVESLVKRADGALYEAKSAGRNCFRFVAAPEPKD